jgi:LCP family protein required for cell wall assembly
MGVAMSGGSASDALHRRRDRWGKIALLTAVVIFVVVIGLVAYLAIQVTRSVSSIPRDTTFIPTGSRPPSASSTSTTKQTYAAMNILLIGSDYRPGEGERSDTFMVLHIPADRKSVYLVSYPRDMWVAIPGHGKAKINAAFSYGGVALAVSTLENLTAARIDHVMVTDFSNFIQLVDTVGPITVDNPVASTKVVPDDYGISYDFTHAGPTFLSDGKMALSFVRERKNLPNGDLDRTLRQRAFVKALALKVATPEVLANPVKLNELIGDVGKYLKVDDGMTNDVIFSLALSLTGIRSGSQVHMVQAPITGFGTSSDGQSTDVVDVPGNTALGQALQNDTMADFVATHPKTEWGYTPPAPSPTATNS